MQQLIKLIRRTRTRCPHCGFSYYWNAERGFCEGCGYPNDHNDENQAGGN